MFPKKVIIHERESLPCIKLKKLIQFSKFSLSTLNVEFGVVALRAWCGAVGDGVVDCSGSWKHQYIFAAVPVVWHNPVEFPIHEGS